MNDNKMQIFDRIRTYAYFIILVMSLAYFALLLIVAGWDLSFIFIWLLLALYSLIRLIVLKCQIKLPALYYIFFGIAVAIFVYIEANVVIAMNTKEEAGLDYIIVLGAAVEGDVPSEPLSQRIEKAAEYLNANPDTIVICSGGKGDSVNKPEANVMEKSLILLGISPERIIIENKSEDTRENIRNSFAMIPEGASVGICTSGYHMYRARLIAHDYGYETYAVPARTSILTGIHFVAREFFGVVQYKMNW